MMDCDSLIDFNSPLRKNGNMLDPLVPLPRCQTNETNGNIKAIEAVGDNPFDNAILQLCKFDDPFEVTEKKAFDHNEENNKFPEKHSLNDETKTDIKQTGCTWKTAIQNGCSPSLQAKLKQEQTNINTSCVVSSVGQYASPKSLQDLGLSPVAARIERKFSKLYLSAQLDKQILDESSKCIDMGVKDSSLTDNSGVDVFNQSERCSSPMDIPKEPEEVKAFVANRIERCIEKALNESRRSVNCSFHRRSLSVTSLCPGTMLDTENPLNYCSLKPSFDPMVTAKYRNRSFSTHDLHSSLRANMWGNKCDVFNVNTVDTLASTSSRFNTGFRKSTATSSMFSSCGAANTGFRRSTSSLSNCRPSNSFLNQSSEMGMGDDSVFMEAKNLSCILQRRANTKYDEPLEADFDFLTGDNFQVELVDSDSSYSGDDGVETNSQQRPEKSNSVKKMKGKSRLETKNKCLVGSNDQDVSPSAGDAPIPLSRDKIAGMELRPSGLSSKKFRNPLIGLHSPVDTATNSGNLIVKLKSKTESKVVKRGPIKAMIPVGNMVRHDAKKENTASSKQSVGPKGVTKSVSGNNSSRKSVTPSNQVKNKKSSSSDVSSPTPCGRPVACSTPCLEGAVPLASPPVSLQVSQISSETPFDSAIRRRSKSADCTASKDLQSESQLTTTPTRKVPGHTRSKSGIANRHQSSPDGISPGEGRIFTSTPLKIIPKNSPNLNRMKKSSQGNKKLPPRESKSRVEKENCQPANERKRQPLWRSSRRVEV